MCVMAIYIYIHTSFIGWHCYKNGERGVVKLLPTENLPVKSFYNAGKPGLGLVETVCAAIT